MLDLKKIVNNKIQVEEALSNFGLKKEKKKFSLIQKKKLY